MKKIAFIGSRTWTDAQRVALQLNACYNEHGQFIVVTGGADGASKMAEATAQEFGLPIIRFAPVKIDDERYRVDEWRLHKGQGKIVPDEIVWRDWQSAATFRSMLIAARSDEGFAFWDGFSRGTGFEIECFSNENKTLAVADLRVEAGKYK